MEEKRYQDKIAAENLDAARMDSFLRSLERPRAAELETLRRQAEAEGVPILRETTESLLVFLMDLLRPERILEVGCAVGYSALVMWRARQGQCDLTTLENYEPRIQKARENFRKADAPITLLEGDAGEILKTLEGPYDFIFMDAAKAQYIHWLPEVKRLLSPGGVLLSDNILQEGDLLSSRYGVTRRDRTIHKRMREYLNALKSDPELSTVVLPVGDGVAMTTGKPSKESE